MQHLTFKGWLIVLGLLCIPLSASAIFLRKWAALLTTNKLWNKFVWNTFWISLLLSIIVEIMIAISIKFGWIRGEAGMLFYIWPTYSIIYMVICVLISLFVGPIIVFFVKKDSKQ